MSVISANPDDPISFWVSKVRRIAAYLRTLPAGPGSAVHLPPSPLDHSELRGESAITESFYRDLFFTRYWLNSGTGCSDVLNTHSRRKNQIAFAACNNDACIYLDNGATRFPNISDISVGTDLGS